MKRMLAAILIVIAVAFNESALAQTPGLLIDVTLAGGDVEVENCKVGGTAVGTIKIMELTEDTFYGESGNDQPIYDLYIKLPDGFEFVVPPPSPATWDIPTSANLMKNNGSITNIEFLPNKTEMVLRGILAKNTNQLDIITFSNVHITVNNVPGVPPEGNLGLKVVKVGGTVASGVGDCTGCRPYVYDLPLSNTYYWDIPTTINTPFLTYNPGEAEGIAFSIQPYGATSHDVQQGITGVDGVTSVPTLRWVDCGNKYTEIPPSYLSGDPTLAITPTGGGLFWDELNSTGPTYGGAVVTSLPDFMDSHTLPLSYSMANTGTFTIYAETNLVPSTFGISKGVTNDATSSSFTVAKRLILNWTTAPEFGTPEFKSMGVWSIPLNYPSPTYSPPVLAVTNPALFRVDPIVDMVMDIISDGTIDIVQEQVNHIPAIYRQTKPNAGSLASIPFAGVAEAFTLTDMDLAGPGKPEYDAVAYVLTSSYKGPTPPSGSGVFLDPRYVYLLSNVENGALPVELTAFGGQMRNEVVTLKWTTATESNNYGFDVERSFDRATWTKVGFVQGNGTTSSQHDYRFEDRLAASDLQNAAISYRLRQIDRDGTTEYSQVVTLTVTPTAEKVTMLQNYPNPFNPTTNISFYLPASDVVTLIVYNELGVEVARVHDNAALESGWHTTSFRAGSLPSGLYAYRLQTGAGSVARTMVVAK